MGESAWTNFLSCYYQQLQIRGSSSATSFDITTLPPDICSSRGDASAKLTPLKIPCDHSLIRNRSTMPGSSAKSLTASISSSEYTPAANPPDGLLPAK
jgi:hypothetical protein